MPATVMIGTTIGSRSDTRPMPAVPSAISSTSDRVHTATTAPTCSRRMPWRRMKAFCAPIAMIRPAQVAMPRK